MIDNVDSRNIIIESNNQQSFCSKFNIYQTKIQINELELYEIESSYSINNYKDLITYWNNHKLTYPKLYQIAIAHLPVPLSTACLERKFSGLSSLLSDPHRNKLTDNIIRQTMLLKDWIENK